MNEADVSWLVAFPELADIHDAAWVEATKSARVVHRPAGTVLFQDGDPCQNLTLVLEGTIRVFKVSENGREVVLYRVGHGDLCVLTLAQLLGGLGYSAQGVAETDVAVVGISPQHFERCLVESESFRRYVFSMIATRLGGLMMFIEEITFKRVDTRLAALLYEHAVGSHVTMTHAELAATLATSREVVTRILQDFQCRGLVKLSRGSIQLMDANAVRNYA